MTLSEIILYNCLSIELTATASQQQPWKVLRQSGQERDTRHSSVSSFTPGRRNGWVKTKEVELDLPLFPEDLRLGYWTIAGEAEHLGEERLGMKIVKEMS